MNYINNNMVMYAFCNIEKGRYNWQILANIVINEIANFDIFFTNVISK